MYETTYTILIKDSANRTIATAKTSSLAWAMEFAAQDNHWYAVVFNDEDNDVVFMAEGGEVVYDCLEQTDPCGISLYE